MMKDRNAEYKMQHQNDNINDGEPQEFMKRFAESEQFYSAFAEKLQVFDPMDRPIAGSFEEQQAVKRDDLLKMLADCEERQPTRGVLLKNPSSHHKQIAAFSQVILNDQHQLIERIKSYGQDQDNQAAMDISDDPEIKDHLEALQFFI